jgi:peptidyl-prolyl cis-trans isomerase SurA
MYKFKYFYLRALSLWFVMVGIAVNPAGGQQILDRIVAIVDDDVILESEVVQDAYFKAMQLRIDPIKQAAEFQNLKASSLENMINQKVLLIQADKDTINADPRTVENYLEQQMQNAIQQVGGEDKLEAQLGSTISKIRRTYREQIEKNLRIQMVQNQKMSNIKVSRREVENYFKTMKDSIGTLKETIDISHILIQTQAGEQSHKEAREKLQSLQQRIANGEDFGQLAKQYSEDTGSAARDGDLGMMSRGDFVREFEQAAYNLQPGEVSDIVETQFGYHIIRLIERRGDKIHAQHILITPKPSQADEKAAADKIKNIYSALLNGANFDSLVEKYSMDQSSKDRKGHLGTFEIEQLRETAKEFVYVLKNLKPGEYGEPVKTQYGFHVLRLNSREEPRELSLDKDWQRIEKMALEYRLANEFSRWLNELKENIYIEIKESSDT